MHPAPVALITGSSRGIGRAIASKLAADGYSVCINYFKNQEAADSLATEITAGGGSATTCGADVGCEDARQQLVDAAEAVEVVRLEACAGTDVVDGRDWRRTPRHAPGKKGPRALATRA